jgi:tetratricopeptide (TPR) repeat protein
MLGGMNHKRCCLVAATILQLTAAVRVRAEMPPIPEKAERALAALSRRPAPGPLFDRFLEAWLESSDLASLESLLRTRLATDSTAASDLLLGIFLLRDGRDEEALGHLRSATEKAPELTDAWLSRATAEQRLRNPDAAIASLTKARSSTAADSPQALRAGELLGRLLCRTGRTDEAIALWKEMTAQRPDDTALLEDRVPAPGAPHRAVSPAAQPSPHRRHSRQGRPNRQGRRHMAAMPRRNRRLLMAGKGNPFPDQSALPQTEQSRRSPPAARQQTRRPAPAARSAPGLRGHHGGIR